MERLSQQKTGLSDITVRAFTPFLSLSAGQHAFLVFTLSTLVLFLPKILALSELILDRDRCRAFGGLARTSFSACLEVLFSTLQAPLQMLWNTEFVITILLGRSVSWGKQKRQADGTSWLFALRQHLMHTVIGLVWGILVWRMDIAVFWWFLPVLAGMVLSIPFSVWTSRRSVGRAARNAGLFLTPEELHPPEAITLLSAALKRLKHTGENVKEEELTNIIMNPHLNALHIWLLDSNQNDSIKSLAFQKLSEESQHLRPCGRSY